MKSRALFVAVCFLAFGITSCGTKTEEPKPDSTAVSADTTTKPTDTVIAPVDTVKSPADTVVLKPNDSLTKQDSMPKTTSSSSGSKGSSKSGSSKSGSKSSGSTSTPASPETHESTPRRSGTPTGTESTPRR